MPVIIRNLIVNAEIGKSEVKNGASRNNHKGAEGYKQRILKLEEITDQLLQILKDQKER